MDKPLGTQASGRSSRGRGGGGGHGAAAGVERIEYLAFITERVRGTSSLDASLVFKKKKKSRAFQLCPHPPCLRVFVFAQQLGERASLLGKVWVLFLYPC